MSMNITMTTIGESASCVKILNGDKELSFAFRRFNNSDKSFIDSVAKFNGPNDKGEYFNQITENDLTEFFKWINE